MNFIMDLAAGTICGIISGFGIGGGTLLVIYMTNWGHLSQSAAQGINLIYFLPTSSGALYSHYKNRLIHPMAVWSIAAGVVTTAVGALAATVLDSGILRKIYGLFLLYVGLHELFYGGQKQKNK